MGDFNAHNTLWGILMCIQCTQKRHCVGGFNLASPHTMTRCRQPNLGSCFPGWCGGWGRGGWEGWVEVLVEQWTSTSFQLAIKQIHFFCVKFRIITEDILGEKHFSQQVQSGCWTQLWPPHLSSAIFSFGWSGVIEFWYLSIHNKINTESKNDVNS